MRAEGPQSSDLRATLALGQEEARTGTTRVLTLPGGRQVSVHVPAGIQTGQEIRVELQGNTDPYSGSRGALILTIVVNTAGRAGLSADAEDDFRTDLVQAPPPPSSAYPSVGSGSTSQPQYYSSGQIPSPAQEPPFYGPPTSGQYQPTQQARPMQPSTGYGGQSGQIPHPSSYVPAQYNQSAQYTPLPQYTPPTSTPPKGRASGLTILLIVVAVLIVVGGGFVYYFGVYGPQQVKIQGAATAQVQASATANVNASATAAVTATAQAQASATATTLAQFQAQYKEVTGQEPVLQEKLTSAGRGGWESYSACQFKDDGYHVIQDKQALVGFCRGINTDYGNFAMQVKMKILRGDYGGVMFRGNLAGNSASYKFYYFRAGLGTFTLYYYPDGSGETAQTLAEGNTSVQVNRESTLTIIARGEKIDLYIDGNYIASAQDTHLARGEVVLTAHNSQNATEVLYSDIKFWNL